MQRELYRLPIPEDAQTELRRQTQRRTADISPLGEGAVSSKSIAPEPGTVRLRGSYRGDLAGVMARELQELFESDGFEAVDFAAVTGESARDGYYVLKRMDTSPTAPQSVGTIHEFDGVMEPAGTCRDSLRSVEITVDSLDNDFGTTDAAFVGVPAAATLTEWYDVNANTLSDAAVAATVTTEFGDVDLYDVAGAPSSTDAAFVYDLPFAEQGKTDVRVWDDRDQGLGGREDADGVVRWGRVFTTSHEFTGKPILSNGRIRVLFDEDPSVVPGLSVEAYTSGSWSSVSLGSNSDDWRVVDVDLSTVEPAATTAQVRFRDSSGTEHLLNTRLTRGADDIVFANPELEPDTTPSALQDLLDPVAAPRVKTANERLDIRARSEVRR